MTTSDKKKVGILVLLVGIAGLAWYFVYRPTLSRAPDTAAKTAAKATKTVKPVGDAEIRKDLLEGFKNNNVGQKNLFQYRQKPATPKPAAPPITILSTPPSPPQNVVQIPVAPPPPRFPAFKYEGFSVVRNGKILGSISEGGNTYAVKEGECLMGQYCITRLTESLVEIEDLQLKRRQTFTRVQ